MEDTFIAMEGIKLRVFLFLTLLQIFQPSAAAKSIKCN